MLILSLLAFITPSAAFSLVRSKPEFSSSTEFTYGGTTRIGMTRVSFSRMNYRNGSMEDVINDDSNIRATVKPSISYRHRKPIFRVSSFSGDTEETSRKVDEYLEFLDKRYNRVHNSDAPQNRKPFPVLNWLFHEDAPAADEENRANALYALGVAGLASERLLQKHGFVLRKCSVVQPANDCIEVTCASSNTLVERNPSPLNKVFAIFAAKCMYIHRQMMVRQRLMSRAVARKSKRMAQSALASIPPASAKISRAMWKLGGGEHSIKFAATTLCFMLLYFAKPLMKGVLSATARA